MNVDRFRRRVVQIVSGSVTRDDAGPGTCGKSQLSNDGKVVERPLETAINQGGHLERCCSKVQARDRVLWPANHPRRNASEQVVYESCCGAQACMWASFEELAQLQGKISEASKAEPTLFLPVKS